MSSLKFWIKVCSTCIISWMLTIKIVLDAIEIIIFFHEKKCRNIPSGLFVWVSVTVWKRPFSVGGWANFIDYDNRKLTKALNKRCCELYSIERWYAWLGGCKPASFVWPSTVPSPGRSRKIYRIINRDVLLIVQHPPVSQILHPNDLPGAVSEQTLWKASKSFRRMALFHLIRKFVFLVLRFLCFFMLMTIFPYMMTKAFNSDEAIFMQKKRRVPYALGGWQKWQRSSVPDSWDNPFGWKIILFDFFL